MVWTIKLPQCFQDDTLDVEGGAQARYVAGLFAMSYRDWLNLNLHGALGYVCDSLASCWVEFFTTTCWMLWKHRCSLIMDETYVFRGDFLLCCERVARGT
ncbi:hypothetical protein V6N13_142266 [Hibiscus sabdariffa]